MIGAYSTPASDTSPITLRERLEKRRASLRHERSAWDPHYRDLSDYMLPRRARFFLTNTNKPPVANSNIVNSMPFICARTLMSGMMSGMSSPARPWFRLTPEDTDLAEYGPVKWWIDLLERKVRKIFHASNVYNVLPLTYADLGVFGTGAALIENDFQSVVRLTPLTIGEYYLGLDNRRMVSTAYREFAMTVLQCVEEYGLKNVSQTVKTFYDTSNYDTWIPIVHAIEPNLGRDPSKLDQKNMAYRSVAWERDCGGKRGEERFLRHSGYPTNPIMAPRWSVSGNDVYGMSPGMDALPDCKQLQVMNKRHAELVDKLARPTTQGGTATANRYINQLPGAHNVISDVNGQGGGVRPVHEIRPEAVNALAKSATDVEHRIRETMYYNQFLAISQMEGVQPRNIFELTERKEEKLLLLGPVVERLQNEQHGVLLNRTIDRIYEVSMPFWLEGQNGILPPPPPELQGASLSIDWISTLAQVQKAAATTSVERFVDFGVRLANGSGDASVLDKIDKDQAMDEMADMMGVPASIVRSDETVEMMRQSRAQQQQAAQAAQIVPTLKEAAEAAKTMSETDVGNGRGALQTLIEQVQ